MAGVSSAQRGRIDGLAVFIAVAFTLALGLIFALERVGAPDGLIVALGPLAALLALSVIGFTARAPSLPDFLAARRMLPALYGGMAFAAIAAGLVSVMAGAPRDLGDPPWRGFAAGLVISALIVAPRWRGGNASTLGDVLATHYPAAPTRIAFTGILAVIGVLTAIAGFELATETLAASFGGSPRMALGVSMLALAVSIVPGGLKGQLWSDAASGGGAALIAAIGAALAARNPEPLAPLQSAWRAAFVAPSGHAASLGPEIAIALAVAFFFGLASPAFGASSRPRARFTGLTGLVLLAFGVSLALVSAPVLGQWAETSRSATALRDAAAWLLTLALARAGVLGTARARGIDLAVAYSRLNVLSSTRIALIRAGALLVIGLVPLVSILLGLDAANALYLALAIGLAFVTPSLLLALAFPVSTVSALTTLAVALVVAAASLSVSSALPRGPDLLLDALVAGAAAFVVGVAATALFPESRKRAAKLRSDPFVDVPLDAPG